MSVKRIILQSKILRQGPDGAYRPLPDIVIEREERSELKIAKQAYKQTYRQKVLDLIGYGETLGVKMTGVLFMGIPKANVKLDNQGWKVGGHEIKPGEYGLTFFYEHANGSDHTLPSWKFDVIYKGKEPSPTSIGEKGTTITVQAHKILENWGGVRREGTRVVDVFELDGRTAERDVVIARRHFDEMYTLMMSRAQQLKFGYNKGMPRR